MNELTHQYGHVQPESGLTSWTAPTPERPQGGQANLSEAEQLIRERAAYQERAGALIARLRAEQKTIREEYERRLGELEAQIRQLSPHFPFSAGRPPAVVQNVEMGLVWQRLKKALAAKPLGEAVRIAEIAKEIGVDQSGVYLALKSHPRTFVRPTPGHVALVRPGNGG